MTAESKSKQVVELKKAPDGGYGWVVLIASFFVSFILDGVMYSFGIILDEIKRNVAADEDTCNLLSSFNTGFLFCSGPIVAGLCNQFGCRAVVMGGAVVTAVMYMITAFTSSIYVMMATYGVIGGVSSGCTYIASLIIIAEYFDKKRGIATGITMAGSGVGSFAFAPIMGILIKKLDWRFTMSICACIILQCCICGSLLRPLNPTQSEIDAQKSKSKKTVEMKALNQQGETSKVQTHQEFGSGRAIQTFSGSVYSLNDIDPPFYQRNAFLRIAIGILKEMTDFKLLFQNMGFLLITLSNFFIFTGYFTPFLYITKIAEEKGTTKELATWLISVIGIVNIPARMIYGFVADKRFISPINLNTLAVACSTLPLFFYPLLAKHYGSHMLFSVIFAIGIAGMNSLTTMYLIDLVGMKKFSNATGIINLFRGFGCFLGPFLGGMIAKELEARKYDLSYTFYFSAICLSVGFVLTLLVSFGSMIKSCMNKNKSNETTVDASKAAADESDLNKNLLNRA